jgi:hypothetical protein
MSLNLGSPDTSFVSSLRYVGRFLVLIRLLHLLQDRHIHGSVHAGFSLAKFK